jgi:hypothetical protein
MQKSYLSSSNKNLSTIKQDINTFLPDSILSKNIRIPDSLSAHGRFDGGPDQFARIWCSTRFRGGATIKGQLNIPKKDYDLNVDLSGLILKIIEQDSFWAKWTCMQWLREI